MKRHEGDGKTRLDMDIRAGSREHQGQAGGETGEGRDTTAVKKKERRNVRSEDKQPEWVDQSGGREEEIKGASVCASRSVEGEGNEK